MTDKFLRAGPGYGKIPIMQAERRDGGVPILDGDFVK